MSPPIKTYSLFRPPLRVTCPEHVPRAAAKRWLEERAAALLDGDRAFRPEGEPEAFAKPHRDALWRGVLRRLTGRGAKPRQAFGIGLALARAGVSAARPLALLEERRAGCVRRSCLLVEALAAPTLRDFLLERSQESRRGIVPLETRHAVLSAVAVEVARLHRAGVRQRDLKAPNILIAEHGARIDVTLVDLEGMKLLRTAPSFAVRVRDLARLAVSLREREIAAAGVAAEDWRRCVSAYLEEAEGAAPQEAAIARFVAATLSWAAVKEKRNRRRGRVTY